MDPYKCRPAYETEQFLLRLVAPEDTEDLWRCYSNPDAIRLFNSDNCTYGFGGLDLTIEEMRGCIDSWIKAYCARDFVRFAVVAKDTGRAVGTVEIFASKHGILRIDVLPEYENQAALTALLVLADNFFEAFQCTEIVTKAIPAAAERLASLEQCGYRPYPWRKAWQRKDYYIKRKT